MKFFKSGFLSVRCLKYFASIIVCGFLLVNVAAFSADKASLAKESLAEESLGQQAESSGDLRGALTHYVTALKGVDENSIEDLQLREKIIALAQKITPAPVIPQEAQKYMARGTAAVKLATDEQSFLKAANEFKEALLLAPWFAECYYNLGVVLDKAGKYQAAAQNLQLYLQAAPDASDADGAQNLISEVEYRAENAISVAQKPAATETKVESGPPQLPNLDGRWLNSCHDANSIPSNVWEVRVVNGAIEIRGWNPFDSEWTFWWPHIWDDNAHAFVWYTADHVRRSDITVISKDEIAQVDSLGCTNGNNCKSSSRCKWRRQQ